MECLRKRRYFELAKNETDRNHLIFLLTVGHYFGDRREGNDFRSRWHVDEQLGDQVEAALSSLYAAIELDKLTPEEEFLELFAKHLKQAGVKNRAPEVLPRWLLISKRIGRNPLGEWGRQDSPHVHIRNTRDFAYLTLKRHGSPMHLLKLQRILKNSLTARLILRQRTTNSSKTIDLCWLAADCTL